MPTTGSRCCNPAIAIKALQIKDFLRLAAVATGNFVFSDDASRPCIAFAANTTAPNAATDDRRPEAGSGFDNSFDAAVKSLLIDTLRSLWLGMALEGNLPGDRNGS